MKNIILLKTYLTNIGNGFIDKGALMCIKKAFPESNVFEISSYSNLIENNINESRFFYVNQTSKSKPIKTSATNISGLLNNIDLVIMAGCILDGNLIINYQTLKNFSDRGIPIVFLGAGGDYIPAMDLKIKNILKHINITGIITRDKNAFNKFNKCAKIVNEGIDCGFFINEWYQAPKIEKKYIVLSFDNIKEPNISTSTPIIRTNHSPFDYAASSKPLIRIPTELIKKIVLYSTIKNKNYIISDTIEDYLTVYANAAEVHTDRVHACVAALSYGGKAKLYRKTVRSGLFNDIVNGNIYETCVSASQSALQNKKESQITNLKNIVESIK